MDTKTILYMLATYFHLKRDTTADRLKLQKTIYLLQAYGLQLGYGFSWYRYGPYSQDLVSDAYRVLHAEEPKYEKEAQLWSFNQASRREFDTFRKICGETLLNDPRQLELVASVDFAYTTWYPTAEREEFPSRFKDHKRRFFDGTAIENDMILKAFDKRRELRKK